MKKIEFSDSQKNILAIEENYGEHFNNTIGGCFTYVNNAYPINKYILKTINKYDSLKIKLYEDNHEIFEYFDESLYFSEEKIEEKTFESENEYSNWEEKIKEINLFQYNKELFQVYKCTIKDKTRVLFLAHHIICDGYAIIQNLFNDMLSNIEACEYSYEEYLSVEANYSSSSRYEKDKYYWENKIVDYNNDFSWGEKKDAFNLEASFIEYTINEKLTDKIQDFCQENNLSHYQFFLCVFVIYMHKYTGNSSLAIGTPLLNRFKPKEKECFGLFMNTLPLIMNIEDSSLEAFFKQLRNEVFNLMKHQKFPYSEVIEMFHENHEQDDNLFNLMINYQAVKANENNDLNLTDLKWLTPNKLITPLNINIYDFLIKDSFRLRLEYQTELFSKFEIEIMMERIVELIEKLIDLEVTTTTISELDILSKKELTLLAGWEQGEVKDYTGKKSILNAIVKQCKFNPEKIAIEEKDYSISYQELEIKANIICQHLKELNIKRQSIVGVNLAKSGNEIAVILGILMAGMIYTPISFNDGLKRQKEIIESSGMEYIFTDSEENYQNFANIYTISPLKLLNNTSVTYSVGDRFIEPEECEIAYVLFTSGTTGIPKGVKISYGNVNNRIFWMGEAYSANSEMRVFQKTVHTFDVSIWEIFTPLVFGGTIVLPGIDEENDIFKMLYALKANRISHIELLPSFFSNVVDAALAEGIELSDLKYVFIGSEPVYSSHIRSFFDLFPNNECKLFNTYGPTEATIDVTYYPISRNDVSTYNVPIGKPIVNTQINILDKYKRPTGIGKVGNIFIFGSQVSSGYLRNTEKTNQSFGINSSNQSYYDSGDLGYWNQNGDIVFSSRNDDQIKIRGIRIEIGELESALLACEAIQLSKVVQAENGQVVCFVISNKKLRIQKIKKELEQYLPLKVIPNKIIQVINFPNKSNGKINSERLLKEFLEKENKHVNISNTMNQIEQKLYEIIFIISGERIDLDDDLFEIGLNSLTATYLANQILRQFNVKVFLTELYQNSTIKHLARFIEQHEKNVERFNLIENSIAKKVVMSSVQKRLFLLYQTNPQSVDYNLPYMFKIAKNGTTGRLENKLMKMIEENEILRTVFKEDEGQYYQIIKETEALIIEEEYITDQLSHSEKKEQLFKFIKPFDLERGPLLRIKKIEDRFNDYYLFDIHHIIADAESIKYMLKELFIESESNQDKVQYKDYVVWKTRQNYSKEIDFWSNKFIGVKEYGELYPDYIGQKHKRQTAAILNRTIEKNELKRAIERYGSTHYTLLMATFALLLSKLTNNNDVLFGAILSGRTHYDIENSLGMFVNTVPVSFSVDESLSVGNFISKFHISMLEVIDNQDLSLEDIIQLAQKNGNPMLNQSLPYIFDFHNDNGIYENLSNANIQLEDIDIPNTQFKLAFTVYERENHFNIKLNYNQEIFSEAYMNIFLDQYLNLLESLILCNSFKVKEISYLTEQDENMYDLLNTNELIFNEDIRLEDYIEQTARKYPDKVAGRNQYYSLTYEELVKMGRRLATNIRKGTASPFVGIYMNRSPNLLAVIFAILKAGKAFVPIDFSLPKERIEFIIKDSGLDYLFVNQEFNIDFYVDTDLKLAKIEEIMSKNYDVVDIEEITQATLDESVAYLLYTSGTTGKPKGSINNHRSLINIAKWYVDYLSVSENSVFCWKTSIGFDASLLEFIPALISGAEIVIADEQMAKIPTQLFNYLRERNVSIAYFSPSMLEVLLLAENLKLLPNLKYVYCGGEELKPSTIQNFKKQTAINIFNFYGPTETCITVLVSDVTNIPDDTRIPIGQPIANTKVSILDNNGVRQGIGGIGEICIEGYSVSNGYHNRHKETKEKFINDGSKTLYRTGDLGRINTDGQLEFFGRIDSLVKIRGIRIELGEIETSLEKIAEISQAVVIELNDNLLAFVTVMTKIDEKKVKMTLKEWLPDVAIPVRIISIDTLPITQNGKIDNKQLLAVYEEISQIEAKDLFLADEQLLRDVWEEVLGVPVNRKDLDFFSIGGNSLSATRLKLEIQDRYDILLNLSEIYDYAQFEDMYNILKIKPKLSINPKIERIERQELHELSENQKGILASSLLNLKSTKLNMPFWLKIEGEFNYNRFFTSLNFLISRHEMLRSSLVYKKGHVYQTIAASINFKPVIQKIIESDKQAKFAKFVQPFKLFNEPFIRCEVHQVMDKKANHLIFIDTHHIIFDGISTSIFLEELIKFYFGENLTQNKLDYLDYVGYEHNYLSKNISDSNVSQSDGELDGVFKLNQNLFGEDNDALTELKEVVFDFGPLKKYSLAKSFPIFSLLQVSIAIALHKMTNQSTLIIESPFSYREDIELQQVIGNFVHMEPIIHNFNNDVYFSELLEKCKEQVIKINDNKKNNQVPHAKRKQDSFSNVTLSYQNFELPNFEFDGFTIETGTYNLYSEYDLMIYCQEIENQLQVRIIYKQGFMFFNQVEQFIDNLSRVFQKFNESDFKISELLVKKSQSEQSSDHTYDEVFDFDF